MTVKDSREFKQHLVLKTNFTMDVSESPEANKKKKPMHENRYPGGWSDAVMTTGHHISQVE